MAGTFTQLSFHIVFSTKGRHAWITPEVAERLYPFIGGIIRDDGGTLLGIGGVEDHVHLLVRWRADAALSDLLRDIKTRSSRWVHETFAGKVGFAWQAGYSAFSVSRSQEGVVLAYITMQREHHAQGDFREELLKLLRAHGVEFEERFVVD